MFLLLTASACSIDNLYAGYLLEHPQPLPKFIRSITPHPGAKGSAKAICFDFNEGADELWSKDSDTGKESKTPVTSLQFTLDNQNIPLDSHQLFLFRAYPENWNLNHIDPL